MIINNKSTNNSQTTWQEHNKKNLQTTQHSTSNYMGQSIEPKLECTYEMKNRGMVEYRLHAAHVLTADWLEWSV